MLIRGRELKGTAGDVQAHGVQVQAPVVQPGPKDAAAQLVLAREHLAHLKLQGAVQAVQHGAGQDGFDPVALPVCLNLPARLWFRRRLGRFCPALGGSARINSDMPLF